MSASVHAVSNVSRETLQRLEILARLVRKWTPAINLVSRGSVEDLWSRHIVDSAQIVELAPASAASWADLGSGGGFPGAVVAILAAEGNPRLSVTCVESDQRKAAFLRSVARETGVTFRVRAERIEALPPLGADVVSARALAPLDRLLDHVSRHMVADGTGLLMKGATSNRELFEARKQWRFDLERVTSKTNPDAVILKVGAVQRV